MANGAKKFLDDAAQKMVAPVREMIGTENNLSDETILAVLLSASSILFDGFFKSHENQIGILEFIGSLKKMPELCQAVTGNAASASEIKIVLTAAWDVVLTETQNGLPFLKQH
ncbi:MAG TPA: hypothetical protein VIU93_12350 [Gallionellaceae bacterium]